MKSISFEPIGIVHSAFNKPQGTPIQSSGAGNSVGEIEIFPKYEEGLCDLEGFSHLILLYFFHLIKQPALKVKPFMDKYEHGIFATRSPARPNPMGLSIVRLIKIEATKLYVEGIDIVNGTPLLDIKPYIPQLDSVNAERIGWLENNIHKYNTLKDDGRFIR